MKKRTFSLILALLLCLSLLPAAALAEESDTAILVVSDVEPDEPAPAGGWVMAEDTTVTPELRALFDLAVENMCIVGVSYEPTAYEAYQLVTGMNHRFLALVTFMVPDAEPREVRVTIYEDLEGNAEVTDIEPLEPVDVPTLTISDNCKTAVAGGFDGLYARVALVLDNGGVSGLFITQAPINDDGTIVIPAFQVPGMIVTGISVALVPSLDEISSPTPTVLASDFAYIK